jgi:hypothetical protein
MLEGHLSSDLQLADDILIVRRACPYSIVRVLCSHVLGFMSCLQYIFVLSVVSYIVIWISDPTMCALEGGDRTNK